MPKPNGLVVVKTSHFMGNKFIRAGDVWAADDPVVTHYPAAFKPLVIQSSKPVRSDDEEAPSSSSAPAQPQRRVSLGRAKA
ncbi:MAG TPA: hypothetical protein VFV72_02525 [Candidatus Limnocylindrales bacterium]|nr:hypothetical protein [Candidatus Limnocylindrales bacterium]